MEIWKDIKGYKGIYQISNKGRVKSFLCSRGVRKKPIILKFGIEHGVSTSYHYVNLCVNYKSISKKVHRLVAIAFIPNPKKKRCVNHIDGNGRNNVVENLEWNTYSENHKHSYLILDRKPRGKK